MAPRKEARRRQLTSWIQNTITAAQNLVASGLRISADEITVIPNTGISLKIRCTVFFGSSVSPEAKRHAEKWFRNDQVALRTGMVNVVTFAVPDLDLHTKIRY